MKKALRKGGQTLQYTEFNQDEFRSILGPLDEIECWRDNERENIGKDDKLAKKSELINQAFSKVAKPIAELDTLELG